MYIFKAFYVPMSSKKGILVVCFKKIYKMNQFDSNTKILRKCGFFLPEEKY